MGSKIVKDLTAFLGGGKKSKTKIEKGKIHS